jgi:hypothetical protein
MKKVYLFSLCIVSLVTVVFFQNCSKVKVESAVSDPIVLEAAKDAGVITFDESAKLSVTSTLTQKENFRVLYEYKISGGFRPDCNYADDNVDGYEQRCSFASGFRVLNDGSLVKFFQFLKNKEIQYDVGYFGERQFEAFLKRSAQIIQSDSKLSDLNEGGPICMDAPVVEQSLFSDGGTRFELAKNQNCHEFLRYDDDSAVELATAMQRLYRRILETKAPQKQALIEKTLQVGFRPAGMAGKVTIQIQSDGRVLKTSFFDDRSQNTTELIEILSHSDLENLKSLLSQVSGNIFKLKDTEEGLPMCADAPSVTYSFYDFIPRSCPPPPPGLSEPDVVRNCGGEYFKKDFAKEANCHSFRDQNFLDQSQDLIRFMEQFR